jgi:hypothetical protein
MNASARPSGAQPPSRSRPWPSPWPNLRPSLRLLAAALLAAGGMGSALPQAATAASVQNFQVANTADFLALCDTAPGQENYVAAIHFCEGFASGAYQYYLALASRDAGERYVCLPDPTPSRDKIKADFVAWTKANPSALNDPPVESIFRYLGQTYPCARAKK